MFSVSLLHILLPAVLGIVSPSGALPTVVIPSGVLVGTTTLLPAATATVNKYLGIPFAASPPLRFSPPIKPVAWTKPLNVSAWKPACIQQFNYPAESRAFTMQVFNNPPPQESEDCLYLNVYTPSSLPPVGGFPVMFWLYGGALQFGNAGQTGYDGSSFAAFENVILVSTNYRTNVFGFPNAPELPRTGQNLGFLDQRFALQWVQSNIKYFGGNDKKVTIFGQSAGALSVDALITSIPENPPFRGAILESGQISLAGALSQGSNSTKSWLSLAAALNCTTKYSSDLTCVRAAAATTIKSIIENKAISFRPVVDNVTLISNPAAARAAHNVANVPILVGTTGQEGTVFAFGQTNLSAYIQTTFGAFPPLATAVAQAYAVGTAGTTNDFEAIAQIYTELLFQCPQALMANQSSAAGYPTWRYYYNASIANIQPVPQLADFKAFHSSEIRLVFGTYPKEGATAQEVALSQYIKGAWAQFARNPVLGPGWNELGTYDADLGALGTKGSAGVTVIKQSDVDSRCAILAPIYGSF